MQVLLMTLIATLVSSCIVRDNTSRAKIDLDDTILSSFDDCIANMHDIKFYYPVKFPDNGRGNDAKLQEASLNSCLIHIGHRQDDTTSFLRHASQTGASFNTMSGGSEVVSVYNGDYYQVKNFMDVNHITCEKIEHKNDEYDILRFKFPTKDVSHEDYNHLNIKCYKIDGMPRTRINLSLKHTYTNPTMSFDTSFNKNSTFNTLYNFFDTDRDGVIKKHMRVRGREGLEKTLLDNYKLVTP